jgi:hypothetical protein
MRRTAYEVAPEDGLTYLETCRDIMQNEDWSQEFCASCWFIHIMNSWFYLARIVGHFPVDYLIARTLDDSPSLIHLICHRLLHIYCIRNGSVVARLSSGTMDTQNDNPTRIRKKQTHPNAACVATKLGFISVDMRNTHNKNTCWRVYGKFHLNPICLITARYGWCVTFQHLL